MYVFIAKLVFFSKREKDRKTASNDDIDIHHDFLYMSPVTRKVVDMYRNRVDEGCSRPDDFFSIEKKVLNLP